MVLGGVLADVNRLPGRTDGHSRYTPRPTRAHDPVVEDFGRTCEGGCSSSSSAVALWQWHTTSLVMWGGIQSSMPGMPNVACLCITAADVTIVASLHCIGCSHMHAHNMGATRALSPDTHTMRSTNINTLCDSEKARGSNTPTCCTWVPGAYIPMCSAVR
jgi:hypothetical protein